MVCFQAEESDSLTWILVGSLLAVVCFLPLGLPGAICACVARRDAKKGNAAGFRRKLHTAKILSSAAICFGVAGIIAAGASV